MEHLLLGAPWQRASHDIDLVLISDWCRQAAAPLRRQRISGGIRAVTPAWRYDNNLSPSCGNAWAREQALTVGSHPDNPMDAS